MLTLRSRRSALAAPLIGLLALSISGITRAATIEQETLNRIEQIRAIKSGQSGQTMETYNRRMDDAWKFYASHKPEILPILRAQLGVEIARKEPSDLVLLDVGLFVHANDGAEGRALARDA